MEEEGDDFVISEKVNLLCPITRKRFVDPVIADCCTKKHPLKPISKVVIDEWSKKQGSNFKCPICRLGVYQKNFVIQTQIQELIEKTKGDIEYVFLIDGKFFLTDKKTGEIEITKKFDPPPLTPYSNIEEKKRKIKIPHLC